MQATASYVMALCRPHTEVVFDADGRLQPERLDRNIDEYCALVRRAADAHGARLVAFPQFGLTGYANLSTAGWVDGGLEVAGAEIGRIAAAAQAANAYVVVQAAERHAAFPDRYFLSAIILTPAGEVGLVHRKNYTLSLRTSPIEVYDRFVDVFGEDAFYPVLDTPIGCLGLSIGAEVHWPEAVRSLALKGAEVVINPVAAGKLLDYMNRPGAEAVRGVRAFENMVYLGMANLRGPTAPPSQAFDFNGAAIGGAAGDAFTLASIDIAALRAARAQPAANFLAQLQPGIHEDLRAYDLWPENTFPEAPAADRAQLIEVERRAWERLQAHWRVARSWRR